MLSSVRVIRLVEAIHASPVKISLNISGAGAGALAALTRVAGCSSTLLRGTVLYGAGETSAELDYNPASFVSDTTSRHLAQHALAQSRKALRATTTAVSSGGKGTRATTWVLGVGATSAVRTSRERRGEDRAHVAVWGQCVVEGTANASARVLAGLSALDASLALPAHLTREEQDDLVAVLILHAVGQFLLRKGITTFFGTSSFSKDDVWNLFCEADGDADVGADGTPSLSKALSVLAAADTKVVCESGDLPGTEEVLAVNAVLQDKKMCAVFNRFGEVRFDGPPYFHAEESRAQQAPLAANECGVVHLLFPGSFRPLHWGHTELARVAVEVVREHRARRQCASEVGEIPAQVTYELAASIVDKGDVAADDLLARVRQFQQRGERVAITRASLFVAKAALFPNHGFIVGVDTAKRILDPKYYEGGTEAGMIAALLRDIGERSCYFVVGGRAVAAKTDSAGSEEVQWEDLSTLHVPQPLQHLFLSVPESRFRVNVSSTELRARQKDFSMVK